MECWISGGIKISSPNDSGFRSINADTCNPKSDTQNPDIWSLEFEILQCSSTPLLQLTDAEGKDHGSPLWGQIKAGSSGP